MLYLEKNSLSCSIISRMLYTDFDLRMDRISAFNYLEKFFIKLFKDE